MAELKFSKKHKIKEDRFIETVFEIRQWATQHSREISTGLAIAAVVVIAVFFYFRSGQTRNEKAQKVFGTAMLAYQSGDTAEAVSQFQAVTQRFSKSPHAATSTLFLANLAYRQGQYEEAKTLYRRLSDDYASYAYLKGAGLQGLAYCAIQQKQYDTAISLLKKFTSECSAHYLMPDVLLSLGECCLEQKDPEGARAAFQQIADQYPESPQMQTAKIRLSAL